MNSLNPNTVIFENNKLSCVGNPYLQSSLYDNISVKLRAFDYANISYDINFCKTDIMFFVENEAGKVNYPYQNIPDLTVQTFSFALPVPRMIYSKGLNELLKFNFDINKMNFLYFIWMIKNTKSR
ncbi:hypothetical protein GNY06_07340 [Elizabethkingia argentiflava]|uniref:Uncharacterized protein n=1 Tax=Elizabethkingia argenteiflava TaxID=2681556 RepID=A0A845PXJ5_9FLAO|nr:hypothetical protein [Elizabethkingia argenteiflava]NAW51197.1 hypothetical protein [Elizabethkingia argenteiflava]